MVLNETMLGSTIEKTSFAKTELSSEMVVKSERSRELTKPRESLSPDMIGPEEDLLNPEEKPSGLEMDCSSCRLQEQIKEGNYELVSKVATRPNFLHFCISQSTYQNDWSIFVIGEYDGVGDGVDEWCEYDL